MLAEIWQNQNLYSMSFNGIPLPELVLFLQILDCFPSQF